MLRSGRIPFWNPHVFCGYPHLALIQNNVLYPLSLPFDLVAPAGITMRVGAKAKATLAQPGEIGRPVPKGNAFGWWKKDKAISAGTDSAIVRLGS